MEMTNRNRLPASSSNNTAAPVISVGGVDDGLLDNDNGRPSTNKPPFVPNEREPGEEDDSRGVRPTPGDRERPTDRPRTRPPKPWTPDIDVDPRVNDGINYSTKKTIAQGMMDIALLTANASQLRYILRSPYWDSYHYANIILIAISLIIQIVVGVILIFLGRFAYKGREERQRAQELNDAVVGLIFAITVVNIFIATFGIDDEKTTLLRLQAAGDRSDIEPLTNRG